MCYWTALLDGYITLGIAYTICFVLYSYKRTQLSLCCVKYGKLSSVQNTHFELFEKSISTIADKLEE